MGVWSNDYSSPIFNPFGSSGCGSSCSSEILSLNSADESTKRIRKNGAKKGATYKIQVNISHTNFLPRALSSDISITTLLRQLYVLMLRLPNSHCESRVKLRYTLMIVIVLFHRICQCDSSCGELISPCYCSGSLRWVHQVCLQHWIRASGNKACELCRYPFCMRSKLKPPCQWEALPMSSSEKRRFFCSAVFHSIALGCVIWSLYVLIGMLTLANVIFSGYKVYPVPVRYLKFKSKCR